MLIEQKNGKFILLELNNNYYDNPIKSIAYAINLLSSYYDRDIKINKNKKKVYVKPVRGILVNLNWSPPKMVISFYNQGVSLDIISNASKLTIPEVEQIINENSKKNNLKWKVRVLII